jgi:uncharacterized protein YbjT (DUF2867 family)
MKVILFGATGMVGEGVLRECLLDPGVERVLSIARRPTGQQHAKLRELVHGDFLDYTAIEGELRGYDACFFCLGISSVGISPADYERVTYEMPLAAARTLVRLAPGMTFVYVSGASTDSSEQGSVRWARVKGKAENAILALPFAGKYMFRPGFIYGVKPKTGLLKLAYAVLSPLYPLLRALVPDRLTTIENVGRAMIDVARHGGATPLMENRDINQAGQRPLAPEGSARV